MDTVIWKKAMQVWVTNAGVSDTGVSDTGVNNSLVEESKQVSHHNADRLRHIGQHGDQFFSPRCLLVCFCTIQHSLSSSSSTPPSSSSSQTVILNTLNTIPLIHITANNTATKPFRKLTTTALHWIPQHNYTLFTERALKNCTELSKILFIYLHFAHFFILRVHINLMFRVENYSYIFVFSTLDTFI